MGASYKVFWRIFLLRGFDFDVYARCKGERFEFIDRIGCGVSFDEADVCADLGCDAFLRVLDVKNNISKKFLQ